MKLTQWFFALFISLISAEGFAAACPSSATLATITSPCTVTGSQSVFELNFITGFSDASALTPIDGNPGNTIGKQRQYAFIKAAEILANQIKTVVTLVVDARFSTLTCDATTAVLGSAGATNNLSHSAPPAGIVANTFYPVGLYSAITQTDEDVGVSDISADFNKNVGNVGCLQASDGWYYGFGTPGINDIGFTTVLLHELTHGLGFASLVDPSNGTKPSGTDDVFSNLLFDEVLGAWPALSNGQRANSAKSGNGLLWNGAYVNAKAVGQVTAGFKDNDSSGNFSSGDKVQIYAPNPVEGGSSISHFDTSVAPNELMEPEYTEGQYVLGLALYLLQDLGWGIANASNSAPTITAVDQTMDEDDTLVVNMNTWGNDSDGDSLSYSLISCANNISCSINGSSLTLTPAADHNGATHNITIEVTDTNGSSAQDSFNLTVTPVNDAPSWSAIPNQTIEQGDSFTLDLSQFSEDVDGDTLTYSVLTCGANTSCSISNLTLTVTANGGAGTVVAMEVLAQDASGANSGQTFNVSIAAPTAIQVAGTAFGDGDTVSLVLADSQLEVSGGSGDFDYALIYQGQDAGSLITLNADGLIIGLPGSGAFAGLYSLTITDNDSGKVTTLTIQRPLRLTWSATSLLNSDDSQTLSIEGGNSGSQYSLSQSPLNPLIFVDASDTPQTQFTASNDSPAFNAAVVGIHSETVSEVNQIAVTISTLNESYPDEVQELLLYPVVLHNFLVTDGDGQAISGVSSTLSPDPLLSALNIDQLYQGDDAGQFSLNLPDITQNFTITLTAQDFNSQAITFNNSVTAHSVQMVSMANAITLSGTVRALGEQGFLTTPPVLELIFSDGSREAMLVTVDSDSQASFEHSVDINLHQLSAIEVSQSDSVNLTLDVSETSQDKSFNILLEANTPTVSSAPTSLGSSGGGPIALYLLLLITLIARKTRQAG
ncbi:hypothetical protein A9Q73_09670 [Bermanella sp. 47_1433_sub80_T6]|nr:hypothetical protein A9Q73_09670 [Bermanella sp. 47_1433_sub80_T6]